MTPARPALLPYAPPRRRRRWRRRAGWAAVLAVLAAVGGWRGRPYVRQAQYLWWQHCCMTYTRPADMVVYEEDAGRIGALRGLPGYGSVFLKAGIVGHRRVTAVPVGHTPPVWAEHVEGWASRQIDPGGTNLRETVLFLHGRRSPSGRTRLVAVNAFFVPFESGSGPLMFLMATSAEPASWRPGPAIRPTFYDGAVGPDPNVGPGIILDYTASRRFYAGQPDPADPSRFTIAYEEAGGRGTVEGRLDDNGVVTLTLLDGPARGRLR